MEGGGVGKNASGFGGANQRLAKENGGFLFASAFRVCEILSAGF